MTVQDFIEKCNSGEVFINPIHWCCCDNCGYCNVEFIKVTGFQNVRAVACSTDGGIVFKYVESSDMDIKIRGYIATSRNRSYTVLDSDMYNL